MGSVMIRVRLIYEKELNLCPENDPLFIFTPKVNKREWAIILWGVLRFDFILQYTVFK